MRPGLWWEPGPHPFLVVSADSSRRPEESSRDRGAQNIEAFAHRYDDDCFLLDTLLCVTFLVVTKDLLGLEPTTIPDNNNASSRKGQTYVDVAPQCSVSIQKEKHAINKFL